MADVSVKLSGTYDSIEAYNILEDIRSASANVEQYKDDAEAAATSAQIYAGNASTSATNAATSEGNASTYATNASNSADEASGYAANAHTSETNASDSAEAAAASAAEASGYLDQALLLTGGTLTGDLTVNADLTVTGDSSLANLSVSGTTALGGTSTAPTPSVDDNSTNIATTEFVQGEIKPIEINAEITNKRVSNIEKLLEGNLYDYQTDSSSAYTKTVLAGAMPYASLNEVGGRTLVFNQLVDYSRASETVNGVTLTNNGDGSWTLSGIATAAVSKIVCTQFSTIGGHKYFVKGCPAGGSGSTYWMTINGSFPSGNADFGSGNIITATADNIYGSAYIRIANGVDASGLVYKPQLFDLTIMFGAGNEPSTVQEFQQMFSADYYAYDSGSLLSAGVTSVISKDANDTTLQTVSIPAEVRALSGYGWSCPSHYNYIDFEAKKFVQEVGSRAYASGDESDSTVVTDKTTTYYPLNPAVETDISAYITDDNLISVEAGGSLTFPNSNGDDYRINVPSSETFMVDLQEAI